MPAVEALHRDTAQAMAAFSKQLTVSPIPPSLARAGCSRRPSPTAAIIGTGMVLVILGLLVPAAVRRRAHKS